MNLISCDPSRQIGTVSEVGASHVRVNLPFAVQTARRHHGDRIAAGEVGELILVESDEFCLLGRIESVALLERERTFVEPRLGTQQPTVSPSGFVRLLATFDLVKGELCSGITRHPRLGDRVFGASDRVVELLAGGATKPGGVNIALAHPPAAPSSIVVVTPEALVGRHCAVIGTTGSGKSWTIARIVQEMALHRSKVLLIDATGEFKSLRTGVMHVHFGRNSDDEAFSAETCFPYSQLFENDLFAIFRPAGQTQTPRLRSAIKSLKLLGVRPELATSGVLKKAGQPRAPIERALREHAGDLATPFASIDIQSLAAQVDAECIFPTSRTDPSRFGDYFENDRAHCVSLLTRIEETVASEEMACVMESSRLPSFQSALDTFLSDPDKKVMRVSFEHLGFGRNIREIVANAVGRHLLAMARAGSFRAKPLVMFVDEAHQFIGRVIGDEFSRSELNAFDSVAKEGRKYGLTLVLSTQRPRDIPEGVMSQMGSLVVHRLTNAHDREIVERAASHLDAGAAQFIPVLAPGEAILLGVGFPVSMMVSILCPTPPPRSDGPNFQGCWKDGLATTEGAAGG